MEKDCHKSTTDWTEMSKHSQNQWVGGWGGGSASCCWLWFSTVGPQYTIDASHWGFHPLNDPPYQTISSSIPPQQFKEAEHEGLLIVPPTVC